MQSEYRDCSNTPSTNIPYPLSLCIPGWIVVRRPDTRTILWPDTHLGPHSPETTAPSLWQPTQMTRLHWRAGLQTRRGIETQHPVQAKLIDIDDIRHTIQVSMVEIMVPALLLPPIPQPTPAFKRGELVEKKTKTNRLPRARNRLQDVSQSVNTSEQAL